MLKLGTKLVEHRVEHLEDGQQSILLIDYDGEPKAVLFDTADWPQISLYSWYIEKSKAGFYASTKTYGKRLRMHRLLFPEAEQVDHWDGDGLNNRRKNLRPTDNQGNCFNRRKSLTTSSRFKGVSWDKSRSKWQSGYKIDGKRYVIGRFTSEIEAADAYDKAARKYFGEMAFLNFPEDWISTS